MGNLARGTWLVVSLRYPLCFEKLVYIAHLLTQK